MDGLEEAYEGLSIAIIWQAANDLRSCLMDLKKNSFNEAARKMLEEVLYFFYSDWYAELTTVDREFIINGIRKEVKAWDMKSRTLMANKKTLLR